MSGYGYSEITYVDDVSSIMQDAKGSGYLEISDKNSRIVAYISPAALVELESAIKEFRRLRGTAELTDEELETLRALRDGAAAVVPKHA